MMNPSLFGVIGTATSGPIGLNSANSLLQQGMNIARQHVGKQDGYTLEIPHPSELLVLERLFVGQSFIFHQRWLRRFFVQAQKRVEANIKDRRGKISSVQRVIVKYLHNSKQI